MEHGPVVIRFPAETEYLRLARLACAAFATEHDFDVRDLDDVRMAVDELCSLLAVGVPGRIELRCTVSDGTLEVTGRLDGSDAAVPAPDDLVRDILAATTDDVRLPASDDPTFRFRRRAEAGAGRSEGARG